MLNSGTLSLSAAMIVFVTSPDVAAISTAVPTPYLHPSTVTFAFPERLSVMEAPSPVDSHPCELPLCSILLNVKPSILRSFNVAKL